MKKKTTTDYTDSRITQMREAKSGKEGEALPR
jgi:hypothetical protein